MAVRSAPTARPAPESDMLAAREGGAEALRRPDKIDGERNR